MKNLAHFIGPTLSRLNQIRQINTEGQSPQITETSFQDQENNVQVQQQDNYIVANQNTQQNNQIQQKICEDSGNYLVNFDSDDQEVKQQPAQQQTHQVIQKLNNQQPSLNFISVNNNNEQIVQIEQKKVSHQINHISESPERGGGGGVETQGQNKQIFDIPLQKSLVSFNDENSNIQIIYSNGNQQKGKDSPTHMKQSRSLKSCLSSSSNLQSDRIDSYGNVIKKKGGHHIKFSQEVIDQEIKNEKNTEEKNKYKKAATDFDTKPRVLYYENKFNYMEDLDEIANSSSENHSQQRAEKKEEQQQRQQQLDVQNNSQNNDSIAEFNKKIFGEKQETTQNQPNKNITKQKQQMSSQASKTKPTVQSQQTIKCAETNFKSIYKPEGQNNQGKQQELYQQQQQQQQHQQQQLQQKQQQQQQQQQQKKQQQQQTNSFDLPSPQNTSHKKSKKQCCF